MQSCFSCRDRRDGRHGGKVYRDTAAALAAAVVLDGDNEDEFPASLPKLGPTRSTGQSAATTAPCWELGDDCPPASQRLKAHSFRGRDLALHFKACIRGDVKVLSTWVMSGGDVNARDEDGWALLHHATMHGREECVRLLLRRGARHDKVSIGGHTGLHLASANRHCEVVKRLVEAGAWVNVRNAHGNTPLHSAAAAGSVDILSYLLSHSADPDTVNSVREAPDQVGGATAEVVELLRGARQLKQARIAQRFALLKIHALWNSGRAERCRSGDRSEDRSEEGDEAQGRREEAPSGAGLESKIVAPAVAAGGGAMESKRRHEHEPRRGASLECTVAAIAELPQEVLRRLVGYCTV